MSKAINKNRRYIMSKTISKIVSLMCSMCLIMSVCFTQSAYAMTETPASGSGITESDIPSNYKWLTASDFHSNGSEFGNTYNSADTDYIHDLNSTLDKTVFTAKVKFSKTGENRIYIGGSWKGVFFQGATDGIRLFKADGSHIMTFTDDIAGCQLTENNDLKLTISFEFLNNDGTNTDLKIGVFFNGNLYQNEYITCTGFNTADLKQLIKLYVKNSALTVASVSTPVPAYLDDYTTTTIGLSYGVKNSTNTIGRSNVDGTLFGVKVTFANANQWLQYGGNGSGWYGIRFQLSGANLAAGCSTSELKNYSGTNTSVVFDPKIAFVDGSDTFVGKTFDLHISTEIVNHDGASDALDVRYGFYFNGKLYNNAYVYSYDTAETVGNYVGFQNQIPAYSAIGSISNKKIDENATQLSINDITADSNVYAYNVIHPAYSRKGTYLAASTFNNTVFGANVTLTQGSAQTYFQIGGSDDWDGIRFKVDGTNLVIESAGVTQTTVTPDFINASTFNGTPVAIHLSTEIKNLDGGASANDVIYGIYIGNRLFTNLFAYNCADSLTNRVVFNNWDSGSTFSPVDKTSSYTVPDTLTEASFNDFSIADGTYANTAIIGDCTNTKIENLTEAVFTGFVNFSTKRTTVQGETTPQSTICYAAASGAADGSDGIRISNHHTWVPTPDGTLDVSFFGSQHVRLDPQTAGTTLVGVPIKLRVVILPADFDGDDEATDALIGILINDKLYNETFFKIAGGLESVGTYTRVYSYGSTIDVASPVAQLPTDLATLTPKEFGVEGTWECVGNSGVKYGAVTSNYTGDSPSGAAMSLMGKAVSMDIEYSGTNYLHFAASGPQEWNGLRIMTTDDSIKIESSISGAGDCQSVTCTSDLAGVDFTKKFNLTITAEAYNATDAKIGVWFNGKLYRNMYLKWSGVVSSLNASVNIIPWNGGSITLTAPEAKVPTSEDGYTCKSLTDYGFAYKTYTGNSESKSIAGLSTEKIVISGKLALTGNAHMVLLGDWLGYYLGIDWTTNNVILKHTNGIFANPITVPLIDVANGQFAFDLVQTIVDADYDGDKDDVQLELWIDGAYTRDYFFMDYAPSAMSTVSRVFPDGGSLTIKQELTDEVEEGVYYNLADGPYLVTAVTTSSDGTRTYNVGDEINIPGDYSVTSTVGSTESTYYVYLWKQGDYHPDGQNDIRDLVALKKYSAGIEITKSGAKAAKLCESAATGLIECRKVLLGVAQYEEVNTALHYSVDSEGDAVMPISGFWGPRKIDSSLSGAETNLIQDKYYSKIADLGVNLINYIELDAANGNGALNQVLQNLSLAEKYNIGVYVNDASLNENMTASQLAERLSLYGNFSSFMGIHVYDEPIGNSYNPHNSSTQKKISDIAGISKLLNKYTNLSAYINLYPSMTGIENYYPYLSEYVSSCNPRVLSYDNYPFTDGDNYAAHHGVSTMAHTSYFKNLKAAATSAAQSNIPFWAYVQCGNNFSLDAETTTNHNPTMSQVFWNVNTALAYGAKGIQYFPLIQPNYYGAVTKDGNGNITSQDFGRNGLIGANGELTRWYNFAKQANQWIEKVDHILMSCSGTEVIACGDYAQRATNINSNAAVNGTTVSSSNSDYGAIVGVFDYYGKKAYYVVNNHYDNSGENGDAFDTVTLNFGSSKNLTVYEEFGEPTTSQASSLSLNIRYGCAALVVAD